MTLTNEQYNFLKAIAATGTKGAEIINPPDKVHFMKCYFETCGFISSVGSSITLYVIQPAGESAIAEYESEQAKAALSEKSYKASSTAARASIFAAAFAGLLIVVTIIFGIINAVS